MHETERSGILLAVIGFAILSVGDAVIKTMAGIWPVLAVAALRFSIGAIGLAALLLVKEGPRAFIPRHPWMQLGRGVCLAASSVSFFAAIFIMPLAETMAIVFLAPILTAMLSGPLLKEQVRPAVWGASVISSVGVLLVLRPNIALLGWAAFLPVITAIFIALLFILNRASAGSGSTLSMQVFLSAVAAPILVAAAFLMRATGLDGYDFGWPGWELILRCAFVALTASTAHWLMYLGTLRAGASQIAPASYVQLLVAIVLGWWMFGDRPDLPTLTGAALIIFAGFYLWRDARRVAQFNAGR